MADENNDQAQPKKGALKTPPPSVSFKVWAENGRPSLESLRKLLLSRGYTISKSGLSRQADRHPQWTMALLERDAPPAAKILTALQEAFRDATDLKPEHITGLKAQLIGRLYMTIKTMPIDNIDDWFRGLEAADRIEALIHNERGKSIAAKDTIAQPRGATVSLMNRLNPPVQMAEFKPKTPPGAN